MFALRMLMEKFREGQGESMVLHEKGRSGRKVSRISFDPLLVYHGDRYVDR